MRPDSGADVRSLTRGRDLALDLARDVDLELDRASMDARALACDVDLELDRARALVKGRVYALKDRAHVRARVCAFDRNLVRYHDRALALDRTLDDAHDRTLTLALYRDLDRHSRARTLALVGVLSDARDRVRALAGALADARDRVRLRDLDRPLAHGLARDLDRARAHARALAFALANNLAHAVGRVLSLAPLAVIDGSGANVDTAVPSRGCRRLVTLVVRVLPAGQRARYAEEFRTEMGELPRDKQLGYGLRLLIRSWTLRRVLLGSRGNAHVAGTGESTR